MDYLNNDMELAGKKPDDYECVKHAYQSAEVSLPIEIKPTVKVGDIETECCGEPIVQCVDKCETSEILITQKVLIKIPLCYRFVSCVGHSEFKCDEPWCNECKK